VAITIPAGNPSEWTGPTGNNTFLFAQSPAVLIDAGVGQGEHLDAVARALVGVALRFVFITHGHVDHVAGLPALRERWPSVVIRGTDGSPFRDGDLIAGGGTQLRALHTPGHSPDHFCFLDERTNEIYCGDLVRLGGTVVIPASRGGDLRQYLASLRRIRGLGPSRLLPAHGPAIEEPLTVIDEYLAHREGRHRQVADLLQQGIRDVDQIVSRIYPALSPRLLDAARETVRAHLAVLDA
jgi:glyoxylase-like metal-dependent hydrolase (beta-lactamase superfamily II)